MLLETIHLPLLAALASGQGREQFTPFLLGLAIACGFVLLAGRPLIAWLARRCAEPNVSPSPEIESLHRHKHRTPTMGGLLIGAAVIVASLVVCDTGAVEVPLALTAMLAFGALGVFDDLRKLRDGRGLSARHKFVIQATLGAALMTALLVARGEASWASCGVSALIVLWGSTVVCASVNSVNLTDGLDGLAAGCVALAATTLAIVGSVMAEPTSGVAQLAPVSAALAGAMLGFLRFNRHPARVFMGNTGSHLAGGLLGFVAIASRLEILLLIIGGVFVLETLSVIVQVASFKLRGKRVFRCAPLHHHFQLLGWSETRIVRRFWLAAGAFALLGVAAVVSWPRPNVATSDETRSTLTVATTPTPTMR